MLKRKFFIKDIEVGEKKADKCFTESSYIVVKIPTYREKMSVAEKMKEVKSQTEQLDLVASFVDSVNCYSLDDEGLLISDFDTLTCFADAVVIIEWLTALMSNGFVPKKVQTV